MSLETKLHHSRIIVCDKECVRNSSFPFPTSCLDGASFTRQDLHKAYILSAMKTYFFNIRRRTCVLAHPRYEDKFTQRIPKFAKCACRDVTSVYRSCESCFLICALRHRHRDTYDEPTSGKNNAADGAHDAAFHHRESNAPRWHAIFTRAMHERSATFPQLFVASPWQHLRCEQGNVGKGSEFAIHSSRK